MQGAGVPVVPGYFGIEQGDERLVREAQAVGFPLLIKAVAGGGGKGMRIVRDADQVPPALASARGEAERAFGDGRVMLEALHRAGASCGGAGHCRCARPLPASSGARLLAAAPPSEGHRRGPAPRHIAGLARAPACLRRGWGTRRRLENAGTMEFVVDGEECFSSR